MSEILGVPVSADLYDPFDTLLICFHDLMNKEQLVNYPRNLSLLKTGILYNFCQKILRGGGGGGPAS